MTASFRISWIPQIPSFDMNFVGVCGIPSFLTCPELFMAFSRYSTVIDILDGDDSGADTPPQK